MAEYTEEQISEKALQILTGSETKLNLFYNVIFCTHKPSDMRRIEERTEGVYQDPMDWLDDIVDLQKEGLVKREPKDDGIWYSPTSLGSDVGIAINFLVDDVKKIVEDKLKKISSGELSPREAFSDENLEKDFENYFNEL